MKIRSAILILIFLSHLLGVIGFLSNCDFLSHTTLLNDDYSIHFSHIDPVKRFFSDSGKLWGYSPFFMAGYPKSTIFDADAKSSEVLALLFSFIDSAIVYKVYILFMFLAAPLLYLLTSKNLGLSRDKLVIAFALGAAYWWNSPAIRFNLAGQFAFIFVSYLGILIFSFFYRFLKEGKPLYMLLSMIIGAFALCVHILAPINIAVPCLILYGVYARRITIRSHIYILASLVLILLFNSPWIIPFIKYYPMNNLTEIKWFFGEKNPLFFLGSFFPGGNIARYLRLAILICAIGGFIKWRREKNDLLLPVVGGGIILFIFSYFGSYLRMEFLQNPWRYEFILNLFLLIPASDFLARVFEKTGEVNIRGRIIPLIAGIFLLVTIFPKNLAHAAKMLSIPSGKDKILVYDRLNELKEGRDPLSYEAIPSSYMPDGANELIEWINQNTSRDGRILIEDSCWQSGHAYWGSHLPCILPLYAEREYIGGPLPQFFMKHHFAEFHDAELFEKPIKEITPEKLKEYFDLYNIKWIICFISNSREYFDNLPGMVSMITKIDKFYIYAVKREPNFFVKGKGEISSGYNHLYLKNLSKGDVIIKYHWLDTLKTKPERKVEKVDAMDDPIGFIKIHNPPREIEIYNAY
ncbi:MAG: hypothetical protein A2042_09300 [Candidatus Schekmanbacteria bacterium GWA2_38_11]|uniref:Glycosyltransferase RgtA/B/C/D-like domain-containing protein n=1 Tax=Candidatus Schekmanbacteria bacterium GWA2_38_11 TaxID=1817876 RepID=A0A1F7RM17_9BACT|nr:MAG: hypothetical protein A2042_09300 [Candidatus Schekmanbacteria bacterium GWA2_38_11]